MRLIAAILVMILFTVIPGCNSTDLSEQYRLNKTYWDASDYEHVLYLISATKPEEGKPCYAHPEKSIVFSKLIDKNNISVILEDEALGVAHRAEVASQMFDHVQKMEELYSETNREDKLTYPVEYAQILDFSMYLQIHYFRLGNEKIVKNADNPNDANVVQILRHNENVVVGNYCLALDNIKHEKAFSAEALKIYVNAINTYFPQMIDAFPKANFSQLTRKTDDMLKKAEDPDLINALKSINAKVESNKAAEAAKLNPDSASTITK